MRRLWMAVSVGTASMMLMACRAEDRGDQVLGTQERPGIGQEAVPGAGTQPEQEAKATARLLGMTRILGESELEMAKLAQDKAQAQPIKGYAARLIQEHQKQLDSLTQLARSENIDVTSALETDGLLMAERAALQQHLQQLNKASAETFDAVFMRVQPQLHALLAAVAEQGQRISTDSEIDAYFANVATRASDDRQGALTVMPKGCGGAAEASTGRGGAQGAR